MSRSFENLFSYLCTKSRILYHLMKYPLFLISFLVLAAQSAFAADVRFENEDLKATEMEPGVTVLETSDNTTLYIVEGDSAAVLIDTGTSVKNLDEIIARLTDKPYKVLATHGHYDHVGNISFFPEIYLHEADYNIESKPLQAYTGVIRPLADGDIFELGGRRLEVVHTPGHTPGSVVLVDYDNKLAFTGDAFGSGEMWLQLEPQLPFADFIESCGKMIEIMAEKGVGKLYVGHYPYAKKAFGIDYLIDLDTAARRIDSGDVADAGVYPYWPDSHYLQHGSAKIVYQPAAEGRRTRKTPTLLLKLDDMHCGEQGCAVPWRWQRTADYLVGNRIPANLGIIGYSLAENRADYLDWLRKMNQNDNIEFWNHGYFNRWIPEGPGEFESDLESQMRALALTDSLAKANLGFTLRAFGPHWTECNEHLDSALASVNSIELVFGMPSMPAMQKYSGRLIPLNILLENPVFTPDFQKFVVDYYGKWRALDTFYLQGHPNGWDDDRFEQFKKIIAFLQADGVNFTTISEYLDEE